MQLGNERIPANAGEKDERTRIEDPVINIFVGLCFDITGVASGSSGAATKPGTRVVSQFSRPAAVLERYVTSLSYHLLSFRHWLPSLLD